MSFDAAWRAFARHDAAIEAPAVLEARVLLALATPQAERSRPWIRLVGTGSAAAAAAAVVFGLLAHRSGDAPAPAELSSRLVATEETLAALKPEVRPDSPVIKAIRRGPSPAIPDATLASITLEFPEALQVVRIRVPHESLDALGLVLLEPDAQGVVDVDVLVGEDGLPRHTHHVRTVQE